MEDEAAEALWAYSSLQDLYNRVDILLSSRALGASRSELMTATAKLKDELKIANRSHTFRGKAMPLQGPARFLASAIQRASADFRMRSDTDPSKVVWAGTMNELKAYFADYSARIRKECPEVE